MNGLAFGCTILTVFSGAFGSGGVTDSGSELGTFNVSNLGAPTPTVGALTALLVTSFGLIDASILIATKGSCFFSVLPNPYPEPNPFLALEEAECESVEVAKPLYFSLKGDTTLSKRFSLLVNIPS